MPLVLGEPGSTAPRAALSAHGSSMAEQGLAGQRDGALHASGCGVRVRVAWSPCGAEEC
ncbi:Hypothetical protein SCLAV_p1255 (plasmid) [Streptomyces clavuligerus]|uniref:Uncharacterized protein n=1 Tax=Streptomyces clavuligerus TaxID=1901 RepID=B5H468_STRCL|nr:hypothetical protein SSCG_06392 [Streptomyces clavuligerus]EFG04741.1 Hypothetical protein SCLAV_p1255 [Streptomyces clavuligerus]